MRAITRPQSLRRIPVLFLGFQCLGLAAGVGQTGTVKLAWDLGPEADLAGYRVHYGAESRSYTTTIDVGYTTTTELTGLTAGEIYYCAVTAYNTSDLESDYSNEISFGVAAPAAGIDSDGDGLSDLFEATYGNGADLEPDSDLDGDGLSALAEFYHGLDPTMPLIGPFPNTHPVQVGEERYLCVRYTVNPDAQQFVAMTIERATGLIDPIDWRTGETIVISSQPDPDNPDLIEIVARSVEPIADRRMEFMRFRHEPISP